MNDKQYALLMLKLKQPRKSPVEFPDLKVKDTVPLSNNMSGSCHKKDPLRHKWKTGAEEKPETIKSIEDRQKRVGVLYNKGGYQLITLDVDPKNLGRK